MPFVSAYISSSPSAPITSSSMLPALPQERARRLTRQPAGPLRALRSALSPPALFPPPRLAVAPGKRRLTRGKRGGAALVPGDRPGPGAHHFSKTVLWRAARPASRTRACPAPPCLPPYPPRRGNRANFEGETPVHSMCEKRERIFFFALKNAGAAAAPTRGTMPPASCGAACGPAHRRRLFLRTLRGHLQPSASGAPGIVSPATRAGRAAPAPGAAPSRRSVQQARRRGGGRRRRRAG